MTVVFGIKGDQVVCLHVRRSTTPEVGYPVILSPSLKRLAFHRTTNQCCYLDRTQKHSTFCKEVSDHEKSRPMKSNPRKSWIGFWIPHFWFRIPGTELRFNFSVCQWYWDFPIVSGNPDSVSWITDSKVQDSGFNKLQFPEFQNPDYLTRGQKSKVSQDHYILYILYHSWLQLTIILEVNSGLISTEPRSGEVNIPKAIIWTKTLLVA